LNVQLDPALSLAAYVGRHHVEWIEWEFRSSAKAGLPTVRQSIDSREVALFRPPTRGPRGSFSRDTLRAQQTSELLAPFTEHRLANVEIQTVLGSRLHDDMNVWVRLVGMERKGVAMSIRKLLPHKIAHRC
jgi:hypothetical protein